MHIRLDPESAVPPFEQLRSQVAARVADGRLPAGTRLPTVRALATELAIAPNTVARAYRELEADAVLVTRGRQGTFVRSVVLESPGQPTTEAAEAFVAAARARGLTLAEATRLVERAWPR